MDEQTFCRRNKQSICDHIVQHIIEKTLLAQMSAKKEYFVVFKIVQIHIRHVFPGKFDFNAMAMSTLVSLSEENPSVVQLQLKRERFNVHSLVNPQIIILLSHG